MIWHGIQIALTSFAFLSDFAASDRFETLKAEAPRLDFVKTRDDGGAQLGTPVFLPPELTPPPKQPKFLPAPTFKAGLAEPLIRPSGPSVSLESLWDLAQRRHPAIQSCIPFAPATSKSKPATIVLSPAKSAALEEKRAEVLSRIRRGYFEYLCLMQEEATVEAFLVHLQSHYLPRGFALPTPSDAKVVGKTASRSKTLPIVDPNTMPTIDKLSLDVLVGDVAAQRRKTQASLKAVWQKLASDVGVPDLPQPSGVNDPVQPLPRWTLETVQKQVKQHSCLNRAIMEAETARCEMMRIRTALLPGVAAGRSPNNEPSPLNLWTRKQARMREAEMFYSQALSAIKAQELKLEGETREAWSRYSLARENLKRINEESLPKLRARTDLIKQAAADSSHPGDFFQSELALFRGQMEQCRERRELWRAIADIQGLMQVPVPAPESAKK